MEAFQGTSQCKTVKIQPQGEMMGERWMWQGVGVYFIMLRGLKKVELVSLSYGFAVKFKFNQTTGQELR